MSLLSRAEGSGGTSIWDFLRRRTMEAIGVALILLGLAYLMALLSADSNDPSFNHAVDGPARNLLGLPGAYVADFALQALGLAVQSSPDELSTDARLIVGEDAGSASLVTAPEGVPPSN